jgi:hypothetical protein
MSCENRVCAPAHPVCFSKVLTGMIPANARLRLSRRLSRRRSSSGALAAPPAATRPPRAPSFRRLLSSRRQARGGAQWLEAPWERVAAGSGSLGAASSESAEGTGERSAPGLRLLSRPRFRSSR